MAQQTFEELVAAVKQAESRGKRYKDDGKTLTTSAKGALGEMQVMPKTSMDPGFGVVPAKDKSPDEIARVGRDYLQAMKQKYGDTEKALIAYNWGPGSTDKWIASGANPEKLPQETKSYVERVKGLLGGNVSRETTAKTEPTPAEEMMTKALPAGTTASVSRETMVKGMPDVKAMPASYQAAFALAALADAQDEEDDRVFNENKGTETEAFFAGHKPVNHLASLDLGVKPLTFKDGGDVDAEDLTKPYIGNPNIKKQGEAARRLAALRDVNTLPDPKTYAAAAGLTGTAPDQMGFSVMHPKYKEIMDVANPAFAAGTALGVAPAANIPGAGRVVGAVEKAIEPAVMRTLERGGKASEMLQALAAPPSQMFVRARPEAAARHSDLQMKGMSPEQIRAQNLTHVDNRGNLIEEISDAPAVLKQKTASVPRMYYDVLEHPELQGIYPSYDMPDVLMETSKRKNAPLAMGTFSSQNNTIMGKIRDLPGDDARSVARGTLLHEGQHAIQSMEGFTEGANPGAFIAYVKARQGKYNADPAVNANVIREMERAYPNIANVADNFTTRLNADKYMQYVVNDPDRYVGETLYRHMPGEVQAELTRVRSNLSPEELKATPHEVSMQQLGIDPANILEMNKMGSRPDRYIGDVEYQPYAHGGVVHRAEGSPETGERLTPQQIERLAMESNTPATVNPNIQKQGEAARKLAAMRDVNTLPDPKTYAVASGLLGTPPDQMGFSVMHPKLAEIKEVAEPAFAAGTALGVAPALKAFGLGKVPGMVGEEINRRMLAGESLTPGLNTPAPINFIRRPAGGVFPTAKNVEDTPVSALDESMGRLFQALPYTEGTQEAKDAAKNFFDTKLRDYFKTKASSVSDPVREALINGRIKIPKDTPLEEEFPQALISAARSGDVTAMKAIETKFDKMMGVENYRVRKPDEHYDVRDAVKEGFNQTILQQMKANPQIIPDEMLLRLAKKDTSKLSKQEQAAEIAAIRQKLAANPEMFSTIIEPKLARLINPDMESISQETIARYPDMYPALSNAGNRQEGIMALNADVPITDINSRFGVPKIFGMNSNDLLEQAVALGPKELSRMSVPEFFAKAVPAVAKAEDFYQKTERVGALIKAGKPVPRELAEFGTKEFLPPDQSGMVWREITDPSATKIQAQFMDNSIAGYSRPGTYGSLNKGMSALKSGEVRLFGLYDKDGNVVNNVEFVTPKVASDPKFGHKANTITQMYGNGMRTGNVAPEKYAEQMLDLVNALKPDQVPPSIRKLFEDRGLSPTQKAVGGMIERQPNDNRRYL